MVAGDAGDCQLCSLLAGAAQGEGLESHWGGGSQAEPGSGWQLLSFPGMSPLCGKCSVLPVCLEQQSGFKCRSSFRLRLSSL